jgi:hypothetical protein
MPKINPAKSWPLAEAMFVEVEISHPRVRQMHLIFQNGVRLVIGDDSQLPLAAELIVQLRKIERTQTGGRS